jgi:hypothetical protein
MRMHAAARFQIGEAKSLTIILPPAGRGAAKQGRSGQRA